MTSNDPFHNPQVEPSRRKPNAEEFECGFIPDQSGCRLFYRGWQLKGTTKSSAINVILHIHGMISHSEPYVALADGLVNKDTIMYGLDLQGHGHSEGKRGDFTSHRIFLQNIDTALAFLKAKYPQSRFILSGESMGGLMVTLYLASRLGDSPYPMASELTKLLLWAPAYQPRVPKLTLKFLGNGIQMVFQLLFCPGRVSLPVEHKDTFRDPASLKYDIEDPVNLPKLAARYLWSINTAIRKVWAIKFSKPLPVPICLIQGDGDLIVAHKASQRFFDKAALQPGSQFLIIPESWHSIYRDPAFTQEYWDQVIGFIK